jgi:hypothetical protein
MGTTTWLLGVEIRGGRIVGSAKVVPTLIGRLFVHHQNSGPITGPASPLLQTSTGWGHKQYGRESASLTARQQADVLCSAISIAWCLLGCRADRRTITPAPAVSRIDPPAFAYLFTHLPQLAILHRATLKLASLIPSWRCAASISCGVLPFADASCTVSVVHSNYALFFVYGCPVGS